MQPQYDVNDSNQNRYQEPTNAYENMNNTGNSNPAIIKKNKKSIQSTIHLIILIAMFMILVFMLAFVVNTMHGKSIDEEKFYSSTENYINTYDVYMEVEDYTLEGTTAKVLVNIKNNSQNDVYLTARGIYLTSDNNVYCVNVLSTSLSTKFYGQPIQMGEEISATLTFENVADEPTNLVITNVNDTQHLVWTNSLTIE